MNGQIKPVTRTIPRNILAQMFPSERAVRAFEDLQIDMTQTVPEAFDGVGGALDRVVASPVVLWRHSDLYADSRWITGGAGIGVNVTDTQVVFSLRETGVVAGAYGSEAQTIAVQVDGYGRVIDIKAFDLVSDNVREGTAHLFYTNQRARASISGGNGLEYDPEKGTMAIADTGVKAGIYGSATAIPVLAINDRGQVTEAGAAEIPLLAAGIYTPTLTNAANVTGSRVYECQYMRVGHTVTVSGRIDVQATTAGTQAHLGISLPIPTTFTAATQCAGTASAISVSGQSAGIQANYPVSQAVLSMIPVSSEMQTMFFVFQYRVI